MSSTSRKSVSLEVLNAYFSHVKSLSRYLLDIIDAPEEIQGMNIENTQLLFSDLDSESFRALLSTSYVGIKAEQCGQSQPHFTPVAPMMYMREIIDKAHEKLFLSAGRPNNIITSGYQRASEKRGDTKVNMSRMGITNRFVNTIVTALQAPEWETLLQRIGADAMLHLLTKTSVFVSLPNDCFCQMSGDPLIFVIPPRMGGGLSNAVQGKGTEYPTKRKLTSDGSERPRKRIRLQRSLSSKSGSALFKGTARKTSIQTLERRTAVDIAFPRSRLFYARPSRDPNAHCRIVGLPYYHILNQLNPSYRQRTPINPENYVDPDPRKQAADVRHLAKYVFPLQFGLSNVFSKMVNARYEPRRLPDFSDRENEIKRLGKCNTPKRLREVMKLLDKLLWRHGKCGYSRLRDLACPSKISSTGNKSFDSSIILEMMAEQSFQLRSQASVQDTSADSAGISFRAQNMSQAEKHGKLKPRFAEFICSYAEVYRFAIMATKAVIPEAFWGCKKNFRVLQKSIKEFITSRLYETITLHHVEQGFSISECDWLIPPGSAVHKQSRVSVTDALKRRELLEEFLYWYFDSFLLPLLKTTFYITESSAYRNRVLYFRQDDWEALCAPLVNRLTETTFQEIDKAEAEEILRQRKLGFSFVRLLPKDTGVRPIVNLRRRSAKNGTSSGPEQSINQILQTTFQILTYEKKRQPHLLGASVFGFNDICAKMKAYKARLTSANSPCELPKLYFVKVDVQACFDTIDQSMLIKILQNLISEDDYMVQKYGQISSVARKIRRRFLKKAYPDDEHPHFLSYARDLTNALRHTIFVDQVHYQFESKRAALKLLDEHITENIVKIGQKYYSQVVGIPQGSVLSTLLCAFFYGDLEKRFFSFTEDPQSMLLRLVDDYLYVTTSLSKARDFLDMMVKGHPEYGCFISRDKTMTNFDYDSQIMNVTGPGQQYFPWCGLLICMEDLSVLADYTRFFGIRLEDTLTVEKGRRPGAIFTQKMLQLAKARGHIIYYDNELNSERTVYLNIYQSFVITAMRMHQYLVKWGININKSGNFIYNTMRQVIRYTYATIRIKCRTEVTNARVGKFDVQKSPVLWLGAHAFHTVMSLKADRYAAIVLKRLVFDLSLARHRRSMKMLRGVVKDGLAGLKDIQF